MELLTFYCKPKSIQPVKPVEPVEPVEPTSDCRAVPQTPRSQSNASCDDAPTVKQGEIDWAVAEPDPSRPFLVRFTMRSAN